MSRLSEKLKALERQTTSFQFSLSSLFFNDHAFYMVEERAGLESETMVSREDGLNNVLPLF